jgi:hypothetical protein
MDSDTGLFNLVDPERYPSPRPGPSWRPGPPATGRGRRVAGATGRINPVAWEPPSWRSATSTCLRRIPDGASPPTPSPPLAVGLKVRGDKSQHGVHGGDVEADRDLRSSPRNTGTAASGDMAPVARYCPTRARIPPTRWRGTRIRPAFVVPTGTDGRCLGALCPAPAAGSRFAALRSGDRRRPTYWHHLGDRNRHASCAHEHAPPHRRRAHGMVTGAGLGRGLSGRTREVGRLPVGARAGVPPTSHTAAVQAPEAPATCPPMP